ncbi:hypothetical protein RRG08_052541 [Elysia crispata]|uniref:Uncharacterized protein n=1 Tax=Elysia crispata TaxID=231223 RepID=A0AAE0Z6M0_9GAST|nr:hypothetical protein RRG08_052541 [Elysia crispata]
MNKTPDYSVSTLIWWKNISTPGLNQITQSVDCSGGNIAGPRLNSCLRPQITHQFWSRGIWGALVQLLTKTPDKSVSRLIGWQYGEPCFHSGLRPQITQSVDGSGSNNGALVPFRAKTPDYSVDLSGSNMGGPGSTLC